MISDLARNWWVLLIRGILATVFGVVALLNPLVTLAVLVIAVVFGILMIIVAFRLKGVRGGTDRPATARAL